MAKTNAGWPKLFPKGEYDVNYVTRASGGDAIVALHGSGAGTTRLGKEEPKGVEARLVPPEAGVRLVRGLAPTAEGTFVLHVNDRRIVLCDADGAARATFEAPFLHDVTDFVGHPTRPEVAFVWDEGDTGVATTARVYRLTAADMLAGRAPTMLAERPFRPAVAYDDAGALVAVDSRTLFTFAPGSEVPEAVTLQTPSGGPVARLSASGDRLAMWASPMGGDLFVVDRQGALVRTLQGLLAERHVLVEGGRTLAMTAERAKARTGSAEWVEWPDPRTLESYVALLDVDSGTIRGLAPRPNGRTVSFVVIEGEVLAIGIFARTGKIELVPWSAVAG